MATMNFKFKKIDYSNSTTSEDWSYVPVGTLASLAKKSRFKFTKRNLASDKRITILISDDKGNYENGSMISCTSPLSATVRKWLKDGVSQKDIMTALVKLTVQVDQDDQDKYFLFAPQGDGEMLADFGVNDLKGETDYEALSAF